MVKNSQCFELNVAYKQRASLLLKKADDSPSCSFSLSVTPYIVEHSSLSAELSRYELSEKFLFSEGLLYM